MRNIFEIADGMRMLKVKDLRAIKHIKDPEEIELALVSNLSGLSIDEIDELDYPDYRVLQEKVKGFWQARERAASLPTKNA
jgi:hypothetical protein